MADVANRESPETRNHARQRGAYAVPSRLPETPYHLRHTFATEALAAGVSIFELSRLMGASVKEVDRTYGHLARDSADAIRARLEARAAQPGVNVASE